MLDFGNVRDVGMSIDELRKSLKLQEYAVTGISHAENLNPCAGRSETSVPLVAWVI